MLSCLFSTPRALRDQFRATHAPLKGLHRRRNKHNFSLCAAILAVRAERRITETMLNASAFMLRQGRDFLKNFCYVTLWLSILFFSRINGYTAVTN